MSLDFKHSLTLLVVLVSLSMSGCRNLKDTSKEEDSANQAVFAAMVADSGGMSSAEEIAAYHHHEALAEFDLDDDDQISLKEWQIAKPSAAEDAPHFKRLDQNGDGKISEEEGVALITSNEDFKAAFAALDKNEDKLLTWEEYDAREPGALVVPLFGDEEG
jgi:hypothetical protein|tara:strand:- start:1044 stop:1526 length:483 start_codon:yes stop_codon:yes gene_type:complete